MGRPRSRGTLIKERGDPLMENQVSALLCLLTPVHAGVVLGVATGTRRGYRQEIDVESIRAILFICL